MQRLQQEASEKAYACGGIYHGGGEKQIAAYRLSSQDRESYW